MSLPSELWRQIIRHAIHNPQLFYTTWDHDPNSGIWEGWEGWENVQRFPTGFEMGTKRSIVMVCRAWRNIGVEFIYESIRIPRSWLGNEDRSLSGLVDVFDGSTSSRGGDPPLTTHGYGWWTKRIDCSLDIFSSAGVEHLFSLLERCHNLEIFTFLDRDALQPSTPGLPRLAHILQSRFSHSLRRFVLPYFVSQPASEHHSLIPNVALMSLDICIGDPQVDFPFLSSSETITTLTICFLETIDHPPLWHLPRLCSLGLIQLARDDIPVIQPFIDRHQSTLRHLYLHITDVDIHSLPLLFSGRPHLRSLAFDERDLRNTVGLILQAQEPLLVKGVSHLGILSLSANDCAEEIRDSTETIFREGLFPDLKVLRTLTEKNPVSSNHLVWLNLLQTCRLHGTRLEDLHGQLLVVESDIDGGVPP